MIETGFDDPVHDSQATFRQALAALAEPGRVLTLATLPSPPAPRSARISANSTPAPKPIPTARPPSSWRSPAWRPRASQSTGAGG
jgi:hypothetical protein